MCETLEGVLGFKVPAGPILKVWDHIKHTLISRWVDDGECAAAFLRGLGPAEHQAERDLEAQQEDTPFSETTIQVTRQPLISPRDIIEVTAKKSWLARMLCR
jgi:hypothetical protein